MWVCNGTAKIQQFVPKHSKKTHGRNNSTTLKDVAIPSKLQVTLRENFLALDFGSDDREGFPVFKTEQKLDVPKTTPQWNADGTIEVCSALCDQLYTVHGVRNGHTTPRTNKLLKRKTKELCHRIFDELKQIDLCLQFFAMAVDSKIAFLLAF